MNTQILIGKTKEGIPVSLLPAMANRHGLITGATGTGKTVTLQVLAEGFSSQGIPVFMADVKGDLSGLSRPGSASEGIEKRIGSLKLESHDFGGFPCSFWDVYGENGLQVRTTISEMGPLLLTRLLGLNETQTGVLTIAFKIADDERLLLLDLKDLKEVLRWMAEHGDEIQAKYGNVSKASLGAMNRKLLEIEEVGANIFFGEPALELRDLMQVDYSGKGVISVLDARKLILEKRLYSTFLLWLLSELFEELEEVGDQDKPRLIFFFDEAHLLFKDCPQVLLDKIETVVRLVRSKGVGIYFVTQSPSDIPESILGQLGNKIQHCLRAYTPKAQKVVKAAAGALRPNPKFDAATKITELKTGESLVSVLDETGAPTIVEHVLNCPPRSRMGALNESERKDLIQRSPLFSKYEETIDRVSAYERLKEKRDPDKKAKRSAKSSPRKSNRQSPTEAFLKSVLRSAGSQIGRQLMRGILGSLSKR